MFKSWALQADGEVRERKRSFDPETGKTSCPQACGHCRAKKVKCTGEKTGCKRCEALGRACVYTQSTRGQNGPAAERANQTDSERASKRRSLSPQSVAATGNATEEAPNDSLFVAGDDNCAEASDINSRHPDTPPPPILGDVSSSGSSSEPSSACSAILATDDFNMSDVALPTDFNAHLEDFFVDLEGRTANGFDVENTIVAKPLGISPPQDAPSLLEGTASAPLAFLNHDSKPDEVDSYGPFYSGPAPHDILQLITNSGDAFPYIPTPVSPTLPSFPTDLNCRCLQRIVLLMDEVEDMLGDDPPDPAKDSPATSLAAHKEAVRHVQAMLGCDSCISSAENMTIVTFLVSKLAQLCRRVSELIASSGKGGGSATGSTTATSSATAENDKDMGIGGYKVESDEEYRVVIGGLLGLQLRKLNFAVQQLTQVSSKLESHAMSRRLGAVKRTLASLLAQHEL